jgi:hypothetical protein
MIGHHTPIVHFSFRSLPFRFLFYFYAINNEDNNDVDARMICERKVRPNDDTHQT